jgi:prophage endopeptidase
MIVLPAGVGRVLAALAGCALLIGLGAAAAWAWQANKYEAQLAEQARLHQADLSAISEAAANQARQALEKQQRAEQSLHDLDTRLTKEKTHALTENDRLRRAVADGDRRLRIAGTCRAPGTADNLSGTTGTASLGDAGTVELAPAAGRSVLDIRAGIIADQSALMALQAYVRDVCR